MRINLFVVTDDPFAQGKLCLVVRRTGYMSLMDVSRPTFAGQREPTLIVVSQAFGIKPADTLAQEITESLGKKVGSIFQKMMARKEVVTFLDQTKLGFRTLWYGAYMPNILEKTRTTVEYGTLDVVDSKEIERQIKAHSGSRKRIAVQGMIRSRSRRTLVLGKFAQKCGRTEVLEITIDRESLQEEELLNGRKILDHFEKIEGEKRIEALKKIKAYCGKAE